MEDAAIHSTPGPPCHDSPVPNAPAVVAAFDVDGTLTTRDCVVPFLARLAGRTRLVLGVCRHPLGVARALIRRDREALKVIGVGAAVTGRDRAEVDRLGALHADVIYSGWLRPDTLGRLRWHQEQGHLVVLVSASLTSYLEPLARRLGVDAVLCTRIAVDAAGRCTGGLDGPNCRGPEKERRLREWLAEHDLDGATIWAYGDSSGDRELLAMADQAVWAKGVVLSHRPVEVAV
jgi:phosphatidylglycerophosphatase C